jgi:hypothetical protein
MPRLLKLGVAAILLLSPVLMAGQEEQVPLGDLARSYRKPGGEHPVIDNDNLPLVMDKAEAERVNGQPVFSIEPSGKMFRMSSPDGSCSLSFDPKAAALISTPHTNSSLPFDEVARIDGTASIHDGLIDVQVRNGTDWELKEIVVGITLLNDRTALIRPANLLSSDAMLMPKAPDVTMLYHLKATTQNEDGTALFRGALDQDFGPATDWHWALVGARGIPPAAPGSMGSASLSSLVPSLNAPANTPQIAPIAAVEHPPATGSTTVVTKATTPDPAR